MSAGATMGLPPLSELTAGRLLGAVTDAASMEAAGHSVGLPSLFLLVTLGSLVPVVPTGALVSGSAAVAVHQPAPPLALLLVFLVAAAGALCGDVGLYGLARRGADARSGSRWLTRLRERTGPEGLARARRDLARHGVMVLVVSRLLPAGRVPVMVACLLARVPLRAFLRGAVPACLVWTLTYQVIGVVGGALFPRPWQGVVAAVGLTLLVGAVPAGWRWLRDRWAGRGGAAGRRGR